MSKQIIVLLNNKIGKTTVVVLLVLPLVFAAFFTNKSFRPSAQDEQSDVSSAPWGAEPSYELQNQRRSQTIADSAALNNLGDNDSADDLEEDPNAVTPIDPLLSIAPTRIADVKAAKEEEASFTAPESQPEQLQKRIFLGVVTHDPIAGSESFENRIGYRLSYINWFQAWGDSDKVWNDYLVSTSVARGYTPIITWEPWKRDFASPAKNQPEYALSKIANGDFDNYIKTWADAAKRHNAEIIIRFGHENTTSSRTPEWYPWQGDYSNYKAAFRHIVTVFRHAGANNVKFMWSPLGHTAAWTTESYPGGDVVDYVGTSILNFGEFPLYTWSSWQPFDAVFKWEHDFITNTYGKPIIIAEVGTTGYGGDKTAWIKAMLNGLDEYSNLRGMLFLNTTNDVSNSGLSWALNDQAQYDAFAEAF